MADMVRQYLDRHRDGLVGELLDWAKIPSVAGQPQYSGDVMRSATWLAAAMRAAESPDVQIWDRKSPPAVYGDWPAAAGAPTLLVYSHHDVRDAKEEQWEQTRPFDPVQRDGLLYGRGVSDAKGQVLAVLWGLRAYLAVGGRTAPAVNVKMLVEGEEETGSADLADLLADHGDQLSPDLVMFCDTMQVAAAVEQFLAAIAPDPLH